MVESRHQVSLRFIMMKSGIAVSNETVSTKVILQINIQCWISNKNVSFAISQELHHVISIPTDTDVSPYLTFSLVSKPITITRRVISIYSHGNILDRLSGYTVSAFRFDSMRLQNNTNTCSIPCQLYKRDNTNLRLRPSCQVKNNG